MNYGTRKDQHNHLFDQFVFEMFCQTVKEYHKPKSTLSTRAKFLKRMEEQRKNEPGEL